MTIKSVIFTKSMLFSPLFDRIYRMLRIIRKKNIIKKVIVHHGFSRKYTEFS